MPYYQKAVEYNPKGIPALNNLGLCYLRLNKKDMAREMFLKSLELDPKQDKVKKIMSQIR